MDIRAKGLLRTEAFLNRDRIERERGQEREAPAEISASTLEHRTPGVGYTLA